MKKILFSTSFLFVFVLNSPSFAMLWEIAIRITGTGSMINTPISKQVSFYTLNNSTTAFCSGFSTSDIDGIRDNKGVYFSGFAVDGDCNFAVDYNSSDWYNWDFGKRYCSPLTNQPFRMRIGDQYMILVPRDSSFGDMKFDCNIAANGSVAFLNNRSNHSGVELYGPYNWSDQYNVTIKNDYGRILSTGGNVTIDRNTYSNINIGGKTFTWFNDYGSSFPHLLHAEDLEYSDANGGCKFIFKNWTKSDLTNPWGLSREISISAVNETYIAHFKEQYNITIQNEFIGISSGGIIKVNNVQQNAPYTRVVEKDSSITLTALNQDYNGITYTFTQWEDGSTSPSRTVHPTSNKTYRALFTGKPAFASRNLQTNDQIENNTIVLTWNENPNPYVSKYEIWRYEKLNGVSSTPHIIETVNRGTTSYTDYTYQYSKSKYDYTIYYDVRPYYTLENCYADPAYMYVCWAKIVPKIVNNEQVQFPSSEKQIPKEYSINNYPNPFNPSTLITFALPEEQYVKLTIYNILGQVVRNLNDEFLPSGIYTIIWNGKDDSGNMVDTGIYITSLQTNSMIIAKKILLNK